MKNKKAQIQITENIGIIVVIIFILIFGFIFYSKVREGSIKDKAREYSELEVVKATQMISNLPELGCSRNTLADMGCLDKFKLEAFIELNLTKDYYDYYRSIFGKSTVIIKEVFPSNETSYVIYNNTYDKEVNYKSLYIPINLYNPVNNTLSFSYMQIIKYTNIIE